MLKFIELAVDMRKGKAAKEGLYTYRNLAQNTSVETIEIALQRYIDLATAKVEEAQSKSQQLMLDSTTDLEAAATPELMIMANVSSESSQDRADRAILTPWLALLWDAYRTVLDILRNNARLENMYQKVANEAFQFCLKYSRKPEFKRLCDLIRNHLQNVPKYSYMPHSITLTDPDTLQRHLDTRFSQLNASVQLELWNEAFRTLEDIHHLLSLSKRPPKSEMLHTYYEKMIQIFLKSNNYLFHAAAWNRAASIKAANRSKEEEQRLADLVCLSALAIPVISTGKYTGGFSGIDQQKSKEGRLSALVGLQKPPTRRALLQQVVVKGFLARARPEIQQIFNILELKFHPLSICKIIRPHLQVLAEDAELEIYIKPLQQVILTRLFQQLTQIYETISIDFVLDLATFDEPYAIKATDIECFIMNGNLEGDLNIRIDHATNTLYLSDDIFQAEKIMDEGNIKLQSTPAELVQTRLAKIASALMTVAAQVDPKFIDVYTQEQARARKAAIEGVEDEHKSILSRRSLIEKRREMVEHEAQRVEMERVSKVAQQKQKEQEAEMKRLQEEFRRRELDRIRREQDAIRQEEARKLAEDLKAKGGLKVEIDNLDELDTNKLRAMHIEQLERESRDMSERMKATAKRLDYLERALRREEISLLEEDAKQQQERDRETFYKNQQIAVETSRARHAEALQLKQRFASIVPDYSAFRDNFYASRRAAHDEKVRDAQRHLESAKKRRITELREKKITELKQQRAAERKARREEEARARAEEEARAAAEKKRQELAELKRQREEQRAELDMQQRKQREREAEIERRLEEKRRGVHKEPALSPAPGVYRPRRFEGRSKSGTADAMTNGEATNDDSVPPASAPQPYRARPRPSDGTAVESVRQGDEEVQPPASAEPLQARKEGAYQPRRWVPRKAQS